MTIDFAYDSSYTAPPQQDTRVTRDEETIRVLCDRLSNELVKLDTNDPRTLTQHVAKFFDATVPDDSLLVRMGPDKLGVHHRRSFLVNNFTLLCIQEKPLLSDYFFHDSKPIQLNRWLHVLCANDVLTQSTVADDGSRYEQTTDGLIRASDGVECRMPSARRRNYYKVTQRDPKRKRCHRCKNDFHALTTDKCTSMDCPTNIFKFQNDVSYIFRFGDGSLFSFPKFIPTFSTSFLDKFFP